VPLTQLSSRALPRQAVADLAELPLNRYEHGPILGRAFELRHNFTAYDATYVALAEALGAAFLTADLRLARAVRTHTSVDVMEAE
jgi:predicted nucleic acid-binding protein